MAIYNQGQYRKAHDLFDGLWLDLPHRHQRDAVQVLAQVAALADHLESGNLAAAHRLLKLLTKLLKVVPDPFEGLALGRTKAWVKQADKADRQGSLAAQREGLLPPPTLERGEV